MFKVEITTDEATGLSKAVATLNLPTITVEKYRADSDDLRWAIQNAINEITDAIVEKEMGN